MVKYYLHTSRTKLTNIFEGRCALINKKGTCHQCSELNGIFNPKQNFEIEKNKIEMAKVAEKGNKERLLDLRLQIVKEIDPYNSKGSDLQLHHLEHNRKIMGEIPKKNEEYPIVLFVPDVKIENKRNETFNNIFNNLYYGKFNNGSKRKSQNR